MATRALIFKKIYVKNNFKSVFRRFEKDAKNLPKREAAFIRRRARSIMKKAPKKPPRKAGRFGRLQPYSKRSKRYGKYYWRKGLYSRPGHPPFHHGQAFNLRTIVFTEVRPKLKHARSEGGSRTVYAQRVGPVYRKSFVSKPVPMLQEFGGKVRNRRPQQVLDRGRNVRIGLGPRLRQRDSQPGMLNYPERPYMRPAAKEARESSVRKSPHSLKKLRNLGGLKGKKKY